MATKLSQSELLILMKLYVFYEKYVGLEEPEKTILLDLFNKRSAEFGASDWTIFYNIFAGKGKEISLGEIVENYIQKQIENEREECAKECEKYTTIEGYEFEISYEIRNRGKQ